MAKRDDKHSMAEDYLARAEWEAGHQVDGRGHSWTDEPKWKYKGTYKANRYNRNRKLVAEIIWLVFAIPAAGYLLYQIIFGHNGGGIFISILILSMLAIFYFISRPPR